MRDRLPHLKVIVKYIPESIEPLDPEMKESGVLTWDEFMEKGQVLSLCVAYCLLQLLI